MTKLDVITGFLGAGKTTLIKAYLPWLTQQGLRSCVIENEYGAAGVDGAVLKAIGTDVCEISGGCVCCTMKVTLHDMLCRLAERVDRIILEPSGLFCGDDLLDILPGGDVPVELGMWCGVVDPLMLSCMEEDDLAILQSELIHAGSVVVSKTALAHPEELRKTGELLTGMLHPQPLILWDDWSRMPWETVFPRLMGAGTMLRPHVRRRFDHTGMFQSTMLLPSGFSSEYELFDCLLQLLDGGAGQVLRIKGAVQVGNELLHVNGAPRRVEVTLAGENERPGINVIGRDLDRRKLRAFLCKNETVTL